MKASSTVVIKVNYGDMLRRFNAQIVDDELILNMDGLREKILSLFSFAPHAKLMLTYIDEDSDVVALVDDDDLRDIVKEGLNPLRITVKVNDVKNGGQYNYASASSTPLRSLHMQQPLPNLRKIPEPNHETSVKSSNDLASKASSSATRISELVDILLKVSLFYLGQPLESQPRMKSSMKGGVPESSTAASETKDSELLKVDSFALLDVLSNARAKEVADDEYQNSKRSKPTESCKNENGGSDNETKKQKSNQNPLKDYNHAKERRGEASDSHSLAERVRREKISTRMKVLQDLVPDCNKVKGKTVMLDCIIDYVMSLQRQVEFLSMKLASGNPGLDFKNTFGQSANSSQQMFHSNSLAASFYNPLSQNTNVTNESLGHSSVNPNHLDAPLCHNLGVQFSSVDGFSESLSQFPDFCEDDLHSIDQMGFGQNSVKSFLLKTQQGKQRGGYML